MHYWLALSTGKTRFDRMKQVSVDNSAQIIGVSTATIRGAPMIEQAVRYNHIPVKQSTFKAGLAAQVHRWFRLTPSFGPDLVREMLSKLQCAQELHLKILRNMDLKSRQSIIRYVGGEKMCLRTF